MRLWQAAQELGADMGALAVRRQRRDPSLGGTPAGHLGHQDPPVIQRQQPAREPQPAGDQPEAIAGCRFDFDPGKTTAAAGKAVGGLVGRHRSADQHQQPGRQGGQAEPDAAHAGRISRRSAARWW